jgi:hypothetical protein
MSEKEEGGREEGRVYLELKRIQTRARARARAVGCCSPPAKIRNIIALHTTLYHGIALTEKIKTLDVGRLRARRVEGWGGR